jgi:glutathione synthase/RimK-type ligase-like ATP-grasp enzyme
VILIVSWPGDEHARAVTAELERAGSAPVILDLARFPQELLLALRYRPGGRVAFGLTDGTTGDIPLHDVSAVWWRRPRSFVLHPEVTRSSHQTFAYNEAHEAFAGLWQALDAFWINPPLADQAAGRKSYQLRLASEVGLRIPETLVTNDPAQARSFIEALGVGRVIYKAFSATEQEWRETRLIRDEELTLLDHVRLAPVIFQEYVPAAVDLRVTIIGSDVFAAAIHSQETTYRVDFRMDMNRARTEAAVLPDEVTRRLLELMARLGLVYGAVDMRLTPDGAYVFLEVNPAGQWLFVEQRTRQPITRTLAQRLVAAGALADIDEG